MYAARINLACGFLFASGEFLPLRFYLFDHLIYLLTYVTCRQDNTIELPYNCYLTYLILLLFFVTFFVFLLYISKVLQVFFGITKYSMICLYYDILILIRFMVLFLLSFCRQLLAFVLKFFVFCFYSLDFILLPFLCF